MLNLYNYSSINFLKLEIPSFEVILRKYTPEFKLEIGTLKVFFVDDVILLCKTCVPRIENILTSKYSDVTLVTRDISSDAGLGYI